MTRAVIRSADMPPRRRRKARTSIERFLTLVVVGDTPDDCWGWAGAKSPRGYGVFRDADRALRAHRWAYEHYRGPIPDGLQIDHLCRNRACVNPAHLEPVTQRVNILRGEGWSARKARQTHCVNGHEFSPENTKVRRGRRECRTCTADREAKRRFGEQTEEQRVSLAIERISADFRREIVVEETDGYVVTVDDDEWTDRESMPEFNGAFRG